MALSTRDNAEVVCTLDKVGEPFVLISPVGRGFMREQDVATHLEHLKGGAIDSHYFLARIRITPHEEDDVPNT